MIQVSAGIIRRQDGRLLLCQRGEGRMNAHLWEFPGGKREAGETAEACLRRELQEELSLGISDPRPVWEEDRQGIHFTFVACQTDAEPVLTEHEAFAWLLPQELLRYPLCPADEDVARMLAFSHPRIQHILWDFDGTLVNTYPAMTAAMVAALRGYGIEAQPEELLSWLKQSLSEALELIRQRWELDPAAMLAAFRAEEATCLPSCQLMPGVVEALSRLSEAGMTHSLVTHRNTVAWDCLAALGVNPLFEGGITAEHQLPRKPAPDMLRVLMEQRGWEPDTCLMIGDRPLDIEAAHAAGVMGCLVDPEGRFPDTPAELRLTSCEGLAALLIPPELI